MPFKFNAVGVVRFIAQGWRQPTLGYACSEEVQRRRCCTFSAWNNAIGVALFRIKLPLIQVYIAINHVIK